MCGEALLRIIRHFEIEKYGLMRNKFTTKIKNGKIVEIYVYSIQRGNEEKSPNCYFNFLY